MSRCENRHTRDDGTVCMTQKGMIKKIIATAKMKGCNPNKTPVSLTTLGSDTEGEPWDQNHWGQHARSVVRMLSCVSNNTRPDIAFAVSQVAQCTARPKESHARVVKCIMHHPAGTVNRGIIMKHDGTFGLKVWADADFAEEHLDKSQVTVRRLSSHNKDTSSPLKEPLWSGSHN